MFARVRARAVFHENIFHSEKWRKKETGKREKVTIPLEAESTSFQTLQVKSRLFPGT